MIKFIKSISEDELRFIAGLDYGCDEDKHYSSLKKLIFSQECIGIEDQYWYPFEVVELGSHWLQKWKYLDIHFDQFR